jgi:hypothetical protein
MRYHWNLSTSGLPRFSCPWADALHEIFHGIGSIIMLLLDIVRSHVLAAPSRNGGPQRHKRVRLPLRIPLRATALFDAGRRVSCRSRPWVTSAGSPGRLGLYPMHPRHGGSRHVNCSIMVLPSGDRPPIRLSNPGGMRFAAAESVMKTVVKIRKGKSSCRSRKGQNLPRYICPEACVVQRTANTTARLLLHLSARLI